MTTPTYVINSTGYFFVISAAIDAAAIPGAKVFTNKDDLYTYVCSFHSLAEDEINGHEIVIKNGKDGDLIINESASVHWFPLDLKVGQTLEDFIHTYEC